MDPFWILVIVIVLLLCTQIAFYFSRYKRCPPDKIMVIYGKTKKNSPADAPTYRCIHGGSAFVWPIVQSYAFLDLAPLAFSIELKDITSRDRSSVELSARFTVGISVEKEVMNNAAERLLGLTPAMIQELAMSIIYGQLCLAIAETDFKESRPDRDRIMETIAYNVETEIKKVGLRLINFMLTAYRADNTPI